MVIYSPLGLRVSKVGKQMTLVCRQDNGCLARPTTTPEEKRKAGTSTTKPHEPVLYPQESGTSAPLPVSVDGNLGPSNNQSIDPYLTQHVSTETLTNTVSTTTMETTVRVTIPRSSSATSSASTTSTTFTTSATSATSTTSTSATPDPVPTTVNIVEAAGSRHNNRLSAGEVTGVAMGTFILGAILAFMAALFLFKQRNKHKSTDVSRKAYASYIDSAPDLAIMQSKSASSLGRHGPYIRVSQRPIPAALTAHLPSPVPTPVFISTNTSRNIADFLPPEADNEEVWNKVSHLFALMHEHVDKYYRDINAIITPSMESGIAEFGAEEVDMAELLQECSSSTAALKHALVAYVLGITEPKHKDDDEGTLFPRELCTAHVGSRIHVVSDSDLRAATSLHRRISVYIYTSITGMTNFHGSWIAQSSVREAAEHFALTFFPWANPMSSDQDKDEDLARIIKDTLTMRIWLFGQLDTYDFEWEGVGERGIDINPRLVKRNWEEGDGDGSVFQLVEGAGVAL